MPDGPAPVRAPYSGALAANRGLFDWNRTGSITPAPAPGPLLKDAPPDVIANEIDMQAGAD
jgi:hypothetical protein